ncbi:MAG: hypothetical protein BGO98_09040 [Myxococcales bacterium 68-20]|nr:MAG: hypothetical protein BGO98_09040 [Myxococcales bacterium 68-20]
MAMMIATVTLSIGALAGCSGNPTAGSEAYKEGELGNGDFLFACDDGLACLPYSGDAKRFPDAIASGATFDVRFVAKNQQGPVIVIKEKRYEGIKTVAIGPYVSQGPDGFAAVKPGYGTVMVRDSGGTVIDYVTLKIVKPDALIVYDANYDVAKGNVPPRIQALNLKVDQTPSYRVVAEYNLKAVAGSIPVEWTSDASDVVVVESYSDRVVNLRAKGVGKTKIKADAGGLVKEIDVEVTQ